PFFQTVYEFVKFLQQVLEGLVSLHRKNIAHLDICCCNILVDSTTMFPGGFHFIHMNTPSTGIGSIAEVGYRPSDDPTKSRPHVMHNRTAAGPLNYHLIDFSRSVWYPDFESRGLVVGGESENLKRVERHRGHLIPEISDTVPYDPFKVDVRLVGEMWYAGLDFVMPLVSNLLHDDPTQRPTAAGALKMFERLVHDVHGTQLDKPIMIHHYSSRSR
ncbi:hypothetical protein B0H16DRAFT_1858346, partial [Mycena metata]